jgi:antitoxin ParD1/3/4
MTNISLTVKQEDFLQKKVRSGRYASSSEVVREALRLFEEYDFVREQKIRTIRRGVMEARDELDNGHSSSGVAVFDEMKKRFGRRK